MYHLVWEWLSSLGQPTVGSVSSTNIMKQPNEGEGEGDAMPKAM